MLANPTARERGANARMGDEDAAEALSATGRLEGSVGETLRGEPPDDPRMGRDGSVGPGPGRQGVRATRHVQPCPTSWLPTPGLSRHVSRSSPVCRRSVCSTRAARRATPGATAVCGTTSARYARASRSRRFSVAIDTLVSGGEHGNYEIVMCDRPRGSYFTLKLAWGQDGPVDNLADVIRTRLHERLSSNDREPDRRPVRGGSAA